VTTVVLADDELLVRSGLRAILDTTEDLEVVGEAGDGSAAMAAVADLAPDVVLMDIQMPVLDGIEATSRIVARRSRTKVLVLTTFGMDEYVYEALTAGASGFMLKTEPPNRIVEGVRTVAAGEMLLGGITTRRLVERFVAAPAPHRAAAAIGSLTHREREVLLRVARGQSNTEIATGLFIGEGTVKTHISRIFTKLGLRDRTHAVVWAYENGLVLPGDATR
jgi:DNA-binding NarL/FixJ family response regulator